MVSTTEVQYAFQVEFQQILTGFGIEEQVAKNIVAKVWPIVEDALLSQNTTTSSEEFNVKEEIANAITNIEEQLASMNEVEREAYIAQQMAEMNPKLREGLARSRGKWAEDGK
jgi:hypothetical protein